MRTDRPTDGQRDRQTDRDDEANSRVSQFYEKRRKRRLKPVPVKLNVKGVFRCVKPTCCMLHSNCSSNAV
jgi:hypothetical protein